MKLELVLDNGISYMLKMPIEMLTKSNKDYMVDTLKRWLDECLEEDENYEVGAFE